MPPKKSKMTSIVELWARQQQQQQAHESGRGERKRPFQPGEVVTIEETEDSGSQRDAHPPPWAALARQSSSSGAFTPSPGTSGSGMHHSGRSYLSDSRLEELGIDLNAANSIYYPVGEYIRPYEMNILRKCLTANTCISLPCAVCPVQLVVLAFSNFIRWFPRSRCVLSCNSLDSAERYKAVCVHFGFKDTDVTIIKTNTDFKKKSTAEIGTVLIVTPQNLHKIVEQQSPLVSEIRCIALCMEAGEQPQKFAKIVGPMVARGLFFRTLVVTPSIPDGSRRTGSVVKRQQLITSLFVSEWEEPSSIDPTFRLAAIPPGLSAVYWKTIDINSNNRELYELWSEGSAPFLEKFSATISLPSLEMDQLLNVDWDILQKEADSLSPDAATQCQNCRFLVNGYRNLLLNGPRVFYLYCADLLNRSDSRAEEIQLLILGNRILSKVFEKVQAKYSYNSDSLVNTTYNTLSLRSHIKFRQLSEKVECYAKTGGDLKGLILCESKEVARVVCESLSYIPSCSVVLAVSSKTEIPDQYRNQARAINRLAGVFFPTGKGVIVVMSFEDEAAFSALDTASSNGLHFIMATSRRSISLAEQHTGDYFALLSDSWEKLRPSDGRIPDYMAESAVRRSSMGLIGLVNKYDFKYEPSRLSLDITRKTMKFISSCEEVAAQEATVMRQGFELTSADFAEYTRRVGKEAPLPETGLFRRKGMRVLNSEPAAPMSLSHLQWNKYFPRRLATEGDLTRRFIKFLEDKPVPPIPAKQAKRANFEYDSYEDTAAIRKYDNLISKLDRLLAM